MTIRMVAGALVAAALAIGSPAGESWARQDRGPRPPIESTVTELPLGQLTAAELASFRAAAQYSSDHGGHSVAVMRDGMLLYEDYRGPETVSEARLLASGSKSFWCVAAAAAVADGKLTLDEFAADTLTEWKSDPRKSRITVRQLLSFTSGLASGVRELQGGDGDKFQAVLDLPAEHEPGAAYTYGPSHLSAFGALLDRRLGEDPLAFLERRVLSRIGMNVALWRRDGGNHPIMASGAALTTREWLKFGQFVLLAGNWNGTSVVPGSLLSECLRGSTANPSYGLTFWLNSAPGFDPRSIRTGGGTANGRTDQAYIWADGPRDLFMAAGAGNQRLYMIPSRRLVVARQADNDRDWSDAEFLSLLLK
ncbi:MAG: serine hydrolase [Alphaproteobacteria bacterium]|nr:serine hydrolase [Alphaproteobacteria bacterium]MBF0391732.1 serine hydrolase [Alphaproteobacteria bacterium]